MKQAIIRRKNHIQDGLRVFVHEDREPAMWYNKGNIVVSKQSSGRGLFSVAPEHLELVDEA